MHIFNKKKNSTNKFYKIEDLLKLYKENFQEVYTPSTDISSAKKFFFMERQVELENFVFRQLSEVKFNESI